MSRSYLLSPSVAKGNGSGHLMRCFSLARQLGSTAAVYVPEAKSETSWSLAELQLAYSRELDGIRLIGDLRQGPSGADDVVVLDRRRTSAEELGFWEGCGTVVALDEGGPARLSACYLIDVLPRVSGSSPESRPVGAQTPNRASIGFLDLPSSRRAPPTAFKRILVSFGGEDPAGLSLVLARLLLAGGLVAPADLTIVSGALRRGAPPAGLDGVTVLGPVQDLKEHLHRYDLVLTQFGLTAFEAAWAGCGVILLNPSNYHRDLSRAAGFPEIGVVRPDLPLLARYLAAPAQVLVRDAPILPVARESLADFISSLEPAGPAQCPACSSRQRHAEFRAEGRTIFRCLSCGALYMRRFSPGRENPYRKSYFFEEYRAQYGKTYIEDWPNLTKLASSRLAAIEEIAARNLGRRTGLSVLDVGCAYGPFLVEARRRGQEPHGLDMAEEAAAYVRDDLGIPAAAGDFLDPAVAAAFGGPFDVLSMWYVIEHFDDLARALRNSAALVRPGGVLAMATPSGEGISARFAREAFFAASPDDHFTIWEPSRCSAILASFGFRTVLLRVTGHHPERMPALGRAITWLERKPGVGPLLIASRVLRLVGLTLSRLLGLGDTFEIYAVREESGVSEPASLEAGKGGSSAAKGMGGQTQSLGRSRH